MAVMTGGTGGSSGRILVYKNVLSHWLMKRPSNVFRVLIFLQNLFTANRGVWKRSMISVTVTENIIFIIQIREIRNVHKTRGKFSRAKILEYFHRKTSNGPLVRAHGIH